MCTGHLPFESESKDPFKICQQIMTSNVEPPSYLSAPLQQLLRQLLNVTPTLRGTSEALVQHPWFADTDWEALLLQTESAPHIPEKASLDLTRVGKKSVVSQLKKAHGEARQSTGWDALFT